MHYFYKSSPTIYLLLSANYLNQARELHSLPPLKSTLADENIRFM